MRKTTDRLEPMVGQKGGKMCQLPDDFATPKGGKRAKSHGFGLGSIVFGVVFMAALFVATAGGWRTMPTLGEGVIAFLAGAASWSGIQLCVLAMMPDLAKVWRSPEHIFLSGIAVIWTALDTLVSILG